MTILVKYPPNYFNTSVELNKDFEYYLNKAENGAIKYNENSSLMNNILAYIILTILFAPFTIICILLKKHKSRKIHGGYNGYHSQGGGCFENKKCNFGNAGNKIKNDILPYRDIPTNDLLRAFWIVYNYDLGTKDEDILSAFLLKWINEEYIKLEKNEDNNKVNDIIFLKKPTNVDEMELKLFNFFYMASLGDYNNINSDKKLSGDEFKNWCKNNIKRIYTWFNDILDNEVKKLIKENKAELEKIEEGKSYNIVYNINETMMDDAIKVAGLKKFLTEFTIINEREPLEVKLFDKYLIYASLFGIADKVYKKMKDLYTDIMEQYVFDSADFDYIKDTIDESINYNMDEIYADEYNAGGGGFSSGGGGSDAFGSDSSGGFR